ncbi:MAG: hypothetical protein WCA30_08280 [Dermatophilaceae bacterium]
MAQLLVIRVRRIKHRRVGLVIARLISVADGHESRHHRSSLRSRLLLGRQTVSLIRPSFEGAAALIANLSPLTAAVIAAFLLAPPVAAVSVWKLKALSPTAEQRDSAEVDRSSP